MAYFGPMPTTTSAYSTDGTDKWFGEAAKGAKVSDSRWAIFKMEYSGDNWLIKFPVDSSTGKASDAPQFIWGSDGTAAQAYTYRELGT